MPLPAGSLSKSCDSLRLALYGCEMPLPGRIMRDEKGVIRWSRISRLRDAVAGRIPDPESARKFILRFASGYFFRRLHDWPGAFLRTIVFAAD